MYLYISRYIYIYIYILEFYARRRRAITIAIKRRSFWNRFFWKIWILEFLICFRNCRMYFGIFGVFCTINCYFAYVYRILCIFCIYDHILKMFFEVVVQKCRRSVISFRTIFFCLRCFGIWGPKWSYVV